MVSRNQNTIFSRYYTALLTRLADEGQIDDRIAENARRRERNKKRERSAKSLEETKVEKEKLRKELSKEKNSLVVQGDHKKDQPKG